MEFFCLQESILTLCGILSTETCMHQFNEWKLHNAAVILAGKDTTSCNSWFGSPTPSTNKNVEFFIKFWVIECIE